MPVTSTKLSRFAAMKAGAGAFILALVACAPATEPSLGESSTNHSSSGLPGTHIHGLSVSASSGQVLLATHDGLFDVTKEPATKIGATVDLMGFTAGEDEGIFYASGHPGPGSAMLNPLGLIKSRDGGKNWEQLSRQGESDFHALTITKSGIVAFDGELRISPDGKTWTTRSQGFVPAALAGHHESDTVLATTTLGIQRSTDSGITWTLNESSPVIQYVSFAHAAEAAGVEPDGTVHYSTDSGATWTRKGRIDGHVMAIAAVKDLDGDRGIWAATGRGILVSTDGGSTFRPAHAS